MASKQSALRTRFAVKAGMHRKTLPVATKRTLAKLPKAKAAFVKPMQPELVAKLPTGPDWQYELKWDGFRAIGVKRGRDVQLYSRNHRLLTGQYPNITKQLPAIGSSDAVVDGELVAFDENGRPSFQLMQSSSRQDRRIAFIVFDVLNADGRSTLSLPLIDRRKLLVAIVRDTGIQVSEPLDGTVATVLRVVRKFNLEGVVAKRSTSTYSPGLRGGSWFKLRIGLAQEFVVGGYSRGDPFNSLLVGYYSGRKLIYAGKVKAGFVRLVRRSLMETLTPLEIDECPFVDLPHSKSGRWGEGLTAEEMAKCTWIKPKLVVQVSFVEWTEHGHLRHARYLGLRDDKKAKDVRRES